jgi:hypothetical protein
VSLKLLDVIADLTGENRTVTFPRTYVEWLEGDYVAAVVLNEVVWWTNWSHQNGKDGWFYRTEGEWVERTRLTRKQVVRAITTINDRAGRALIERMTKRAEGSPTMHFRLDDRAFADLVKGEWKLPKGQNRNVPKGTIQTAETASSLTDKTTDKTTETGPTDGVNAAPSPSVPESAQPIPPVRRGAPLPNGREPGHVYALVDAYAAAKGMKASDIADRQRREAFNAFKSLPAWVGPEEVRGCVSYLRTDPWWREPGRLTTKKLVETIGDWNASGRPQAIAPKPGKEGRLDLGQILNQVAEYERRGE